VRPLAAQVVLELGRRPEDVDDLLAARGGVDLLGDRLEADALGREFSSISDNGLRE
jgi:hypothetical protein